MKGSEQPSRSTNLCETWVRLDHLRRRVHPKASQSTTRPRICQRTLMRRRQRDSLHRSSQHRRNELLHYSSHHQQDQLARPRHLLSLHISPRLQPAHQGHLPNLRILEVLPRPAIDEPARVCAWCATVMATFESQQRRQPHFGHNGTHTAISERLQGHHSHRTRHDSLENWRRISLTEPTRERLTGQHSAPLPVRAVSAHFPHGKAPTGRSRREEGLAPLMRTPLPLAPWASLVRLPSCHVDRLALVHLLAVADGVDP